MRGTRIGDEMVELEGTPEAETPKAVKIQFTNGPFTWVPKSQIINQIETDSGTKMYHITEWFAKKEGLV